MSQLTEIITDPFTEVAQPTEEDDVGLIRNVSLLSSHSRNGYDYASAALQAAVALYDGKAVFLDHSPDRSKPHARSTRDLAGTITNPRFEGGRIRADVRVLATEAGRTFAAIARSNPPNVGMSHVALGRRSADGKIVEAIVDVISVDAVFNPATNSNFREQAMTLEELRSQYPDLIKQIEAAAIANHKPDDPPVDPQKIAQEAAVAERTRQKEIRALCEAAGLPGEADRLCEAEITVEDARKALFEAMCRTRTAPAGDAKAGKAADLGESADPDARFKKEYAEQRATLIGMGISEAAYVRSRRIDEGLDALPMGQKLADKK